MLSILKAHHLVHQLNLLHTISFVTVNEYLYLLRAVAQVLGEPSLGLGRRAMLYLAAAVSDFFIPQQKLASLTPLFSLLFSFSLSVSKSSVEKKKKKNYSPLLQSEHKIQSGKGSLVIEMDAVPKVLKDVTNEWSNQAFIVSFKVSLYTHICSISQRKLAQHSSKY
jgi:phosphopantothenate-cysteine ligase